MRYISLNREIGKGLVDVGKQLGEYLDRYKLLIASKHEESEVERGILALRLKRRNLVLLGSFFFYSSLCSKKHALRGRGKRVEWGCKRNDGLCCLPKCPKVLEGQEVRKKIKKSS